MPDLPEQVQSLISPLPLTPQPSSLQTMSPAMSLYAALVGSKICLRSAIEGAAHLLLGIPASCILQALQGSIVMPQLQLAQCPVGTPPQALHQCTCQRVPAMPIHASTDFRLTDRTMQWKLSIPLRLSEDAAVFCMLLMTQCLAPCTDEDTDVCDRPPDPPTFLDNMIPKQHCQLHCQLHRAAT